MRIIEMTPEQWLAVPDNPIQRDTEKHARKASQRHLKHPSVTHESVAAAELPSGELIKLDGHSRALLWATKKLEAPRKLSVNVYPAADLTVVCALYKEFDSKDAVELASDRLSGAYRLHGIFPQSNLLKAGGVPSALLILNKEREIYDNVLAYKDELLLIDQLDANTREMPSTLIAAALVTLTAAGSDGMRFWRAYITGDGIRINGASDGVDELTRIVADLRARGLLAGGGSVMRRAQVGRAISCFEAYMNDRSFTVGAKESDLIAYMRKALVSKALRGHVGRR